MVTKYWEYIQSTNSLKEVYVVVFSTSDKPLTAIIGLVNLVGDYEIPVDKEWIQLLKQATNNLDNNIRVVGRNCRGKRYKDARVYQNRGGDRWLRCVSCKHAASLYRCCEYILQPFIFQ